MIINTRPGSRTTINHRLNDQAETSSRTTEQVVAMTEFNSEGVVVRLATPDGMTMLGQVKVEVWNNTLQLFYWDEDAEDAERRRDSITLCPNIDQSIKETA